MRDTESQNNSIDAVIAAISEVSSVPEADIEPDTPLASLGFDSLKLVSLFIALEKRFGVNLIKAGLSREDLATPAALAAVLQRHQSQ